MNGVQEQIRTAAEYIMLTQVACAIVSTVIIVIATAYWGGE